MINRIIKRLVFKFIKGPQGYGNPVDTNVWNNQFRDGDWEKLSSLDEMSHYMVILGPILHCD